LGNICGKFSIAILAIHIWNKAIAFSGAWIVVLEDTATGSGGGF
jgi:hypothetical protein